MKNKAEIAGLGFSIVIIMVAYAHVFGFDPLNNLPVSTRLTLTVGIVLGVLLRESASFLWE